MERILLYLIGFDLQSTQQAHGPPHSVALWQIRSETWQICISRTRKASNYSGLPKYALQGRLCRETHLYKHSTSLMTFCSSNRLDMLDN